MWPASVAIPSERSIIACAPAAASARPSAIRGIGRKCASTNASGPSARPSRIARPPALAPSGPVTPTRSPTCAPSRSTTASSASAQPTTVTAIVSAGARTRSPPAMVVPVRSHSASIAPTSSSTASAPKPAGSPSVTYTSPASAPIAPRSESAAASARCPASAGDTRGWSRRKWTPSTIASTLTAWNGRARTTAASSPSQRTRRSGRDRSSRSEAAIRGSAPPVAATCELPVAVDDGGAVEVVRRQLDAHAVAREDADAEAAHLPGDVAEDHVIVVELHAEHRGGEGLDDLALELDLLFLCHARSSLAADPPPEPRSAGARTGPLRAIRAGSRRPRRRAAAAPAASRRPAAGGRGGLRRGLVERRRIALAAVAGAGAVGCRRARRLAVDRARAARARDRSALRTGAVVEAVAGPVVEAGAVVEAAAAAARVLAEERPRHERMLGLREAAAEPAAGDLHVLAPQLGRDRAAGDARHRLARLRVPEPDGGRQVRREADEPCVGEVVGRAGLAAGGTADLRRVGEAGARLDVLLEDLRPLVRHAVGERTVLARAAEVVDVAVGERDLADRDRPVAPAAGGDRRVRVRHLERRDAERQAAEALRRVGVQARLDAHVVGGLAHGPRADVGVELGVDAVVGLQRRLDEVDAPGVGVAVGVDRVIRRGRQPAGRERPRLGGRRVRVDAAAQRGHEHHDLERRPRLPMALGGEVELRVAVA